MNWIGKENNCIGKIKFKDKYMNGLKWNRKGYDGKNSIIYELKSGKGYVKEYNDFMN